MIGSLRQWAARMWAARYWPKVGAGVVTLFDYANERTLTSLVPRHRVQSTLPERAVVNTNPRRTVTYLED